MADDPQAPPPPSREVPVREAPELRVPAVLAGAAAWCWRILVILGAFILLILLLSHLMLLVVPFLAALLSAALLMPIANWLRRHRFNRAWSTLFTVVFALLVLGSIGFYVTDRAIADYPKLVDQSNDAVHQAQDFLTKPPFNLNKSSVNNIGDTITKQLDSHKGEIASGLIKAGRTAIEVLTGVVLWLFLTIMLIYDGDRVWNWVVRLFPRGAEERVRGAGQRAWRTLSGYISGQFTVALFHAVAIGVTLVILGSPLVAPLAVLVFIGSFIPIIGAVVFGAFAVLVTLVAGGVVKAIILLAVLLVENQVEGHVLQPFVVGRYVRLHPIAIAVTLTAGALLAGIPGAIFGVPLVATVNAAVKFLSGREDAEGRPLPGRDGGGEDPPPVTSQ
ncbi:MAG TPA: AI-2E family transporter [Mycobacteriales bacterium]|nr:AI-2E family transporter [Mycobacteriales bacterium]